MRDQLLEKINSLVIKSVNSEAECVYLLTQIRKYLEQQKLDGFYNLRMCVNWCLHSSLDNTYVQTFLQEIDLFLQDYFRDNSVSLRSYPVLEGKLSFFKSLRQELFKFLESIGVESKLCSDNDIFKQFLYYFEQVIEDTPLYCKPINPLNYLSEVTFSKRKSIYHNKLEFSEYYWTIKKDGKIMLRISLDAKNINFGFAEMLINSWVIIRREDGE
ncbi:hypothetical protein ACR79P_09020 [Sphingobacterium spiritivorum]|uniref:hypothetical protein n=1 Tax=Sphingobacterium spiritivorum TaxID=258 RepID=UPI003DA20DDB